MSSKTDIWMPLYIGDYLAATPHLSALESGAYLHLLMHQWMNGELPGSQESLRRIARVELDAWSNAWEVLEPFFAHAEGHPVQERLEKIRDEWNGKKAKATEKAVGAAKARWEKNASSISQAMHEVCPSPSSSPTPLKKQKPSRAKAASDPRHVTFKVAIDTYAAHVRVKLAWDASEAKQLDSLLKSAPDMTLAEFQACLNHRARSPGTPHGDRPRVWLPNILKYQQGPLNEFGKTEHGKGETPDARVGMSSVPQMSEEEQLEIRDRIEARRRERAG